MKCKMRTNNRFTVGRSVSLGITLILATNVLVACSRGVDDEGKREVLRIGVLYNSKDNESGIRQELTDDYELTHPNVDIELTSAINMDDERIESFSGNLDRPKLYEALKQMLGGNNPVDVVILDDATYLHRLTQDNLLTPLDPLLQEDKFDLDDYLPKVVNGLRDTDDHSIYALTPTFAGTALYYNKRLFADAGIAPPTDNMLWPDVLMLAKKAAAGEGKNRKFGLSFDRWGANGLNDVLSYSAPLQVKMFDKQAWKMTVDTPQWNRAWNDIAALYTDKTVPTQSDLNSSNDNGNSDLFLKGRLAMLIGGYDYINTLAAAHTYSSDPVTKSLDWDVVSLPHFVEAPEIGGSVALTNLMAIGAKAPNKKTAWDFIQYNNSERMAKLKSRSSSNLPIRRSLLKPKDGMSYNIDAFFALDPVPPLEERQELYWDTPNLSPAFKLGQPLFQDVIDGKTTVKDALQTWQNKGNALMQDIKRNPAAYDNSESHWGGMGWLNVG
ncbi:ABC transporter substrate-binding protein [Paenibacillus sp. CF384]|uniref:ABC transporter substrate-binding protein n=1 Tax=Paenibacillus sp. CF384 TaxID=1884382 RepID=UPI00089BAB03|nr:extracellular solute-binding protein [Paenibacillus sp. CF384]SDW11051.1 multiple sugar transport system substrate-binding protein [Paenibacillus sp. CF384]